MVKDYKEHTELNLVSAGEQSVYIQFSVLSTCENILDVDLENINVGSKLSNLHTFR